MESSVRSSVSRRDLQILATWVFGILLLSWLSSLPMRDGEMAWYATLAKPAFTPPPWSFGVVWPILYVLMAIAAWLVWRRREEWNVRPALMWFAIQLSVNLAWTGFFFGLQSPLLGFGWILILLPLIGVTIVRFRDHSRLAALLLLPYLGWTCFATVLAYSIWQMN